MATTADYTFTANITVNVTGNLTDSNVTGRRRFYFRNYKHEYDLISDRYKNGIITAGSLNASFAIAVNLILLVTILSNRALRRSMFYWNIISLCICGLFSGFIIVPFTTNKFHLEKWLHGGEFCQVFALLDYTQVALPGTIFICMQIDRFIKLRMRGRPTINLGCRIVQTILFVFPWLFILVVCVPLLVVGKSDYGRIFQRFQEEYCFHILKREYYKILLYMMLFGPISLLIVFSIVSFINLKLTESKWKRMSEAESKSRDLDSTRSTSKTTIIATVIFVLFWLPFVGTLLTIQICSTLRKRGCFPKEIVYLASYSCGAMASYMRQIPWFLLPDMRASATELAQNTSSGIMRKVNVVRKYISNEPLIVEWSSKQTEIMQEKTENLDSDTKRI
ncbi:hypothetical protein FSP39_009583 [Pinctada imbricata]|uniref:G-protein coupled receptors family 1 profile domain-containing protein n=1 Tax=Pinctada imbricata TaxID=66713 RepID=A0AA89BN94_PINIB|nr:hypothetical protein FSP39_009583 [Pinctada imbricata]